MFGPRKVDPLVGIATSVMKEGDLRRNAEKQTNETLGVFSRRQLPHERHAEYDALLVQNVDEALGKSKTLTEDGHGDEDEPKKPDTPNQVVAQRHGDWVTKNATATVVGGEKVATQLSAPKNTAHGDALDKAKGKYTDKQGNVASIRETFEQFMRRLIREGQFDQIERVKKAWDAANKGTTAEKQKNQILGWYDKSHKKPGAPVSKKSK